MSDSLQHYGVPGMRWGKRKAVSSSSDSSSSSAKKTKEPKEKKELTDDQKAARKSRNTRTALALTAFGVKYGPGIAKVGGLAVGTLVVGLNAKKMAKGEAAANAAVRGIGSEVFTRLKADADGVWRLADI